MIIQGSNCRISFPINRIFLTWNCNQITIFFLLVVIKRNQFSNIISVPQIQQAFTWHVNPKFCSISGYCLSIFLEKYKCTFRFFLPCLKELLVSIQFNRSHFLLNKRILKQMQLAVVSIHLQIIGLLYLFNNSSHIAFPVFRDIAVHPVQKELYKN